MNIDRAIDVLTSTREQAESMAALYRNTVIPRASAELVSAQNQLDEYEAKIVEIDALLAMAEPSKEQAA